MKKMWVLITVALLVCVIGVCAFAACDADTTKDFSSADKTGSVALVKSFFAGTLGNPDFVVTCKDGEGETVFTETVKDDASYLVESDGSETYVYKIGDVYYWANVTKESDGKGGVIEEHTYNCSDSTKESYLEDMGLIYLANYCQFMTYMDVEDMLSEKEGSFDCKSHSEKIDGHMKGTLTLEYVATDGTFNIEATSEDNLVKTVHIATEGIAAFEGDYDFTLTFVYGSATVTLPDTEAWDREEAAKRKRIEDNESAISDRDDYFASAIYAENVSVTVMDMSRFTTLLTETVANGIDRADFGSYKTYAYQEENDEEVDYYVVYDGEEKTYAVNPDDYDEHCSVWYDSFIALMDEEYLTTADFTFEVKNGTMTYNVKEGNTVIYSVSVTKAQDAITQIAIVKSDSNGNSAMTAIMLSYNGSQLQKPDLSAYAVAG